MQQYDFKHFENNLGIIYCSLRYHSRLKMISVKWKGTVQESGIKLIKDETLEMISRYDCQFLLNDFEELYTESAKILVDLVRSEWDNEVLQAGIKTVIHVLKPNMEIPVIANEANSGKKFFYNKLDAVEWIEKQLDR